MASKGMLTPVEFSTEPGVLHNGQNNLLTLVQNQQVRFQSEGSDDWVKKVRMNLGRFRAITETEPNVHWTVRQRV